MAHRLYNFSNATTLAKYKAERKTTKIIITQLAQQSMRRPSLVGQKQPILQMVFNFNSTKAVAHQKLFRGPQVEKP